MQSDLKRKPDWLKVKLPLGTNYSLVKKIVRENHLHTICQSGNCPNKSECWSAGTATFMILGDICSRNCTFCGVQNGKPQSPDESEPIKVAEAVQLMRLKHCVITSVTRDDLLDKGSEHWAKTIESIKKINPTTTVEVLIPDFRDDEKALDRVCNQKPEIISHNMETVRSFYKAIRPQANYDRSLRQIKAVADKKMISKSGFMLGLGETDAEVEELISDLSKTGMKILTIGQYLPPSKEHFPLKEYVRPEKFIYFKNFAHELGIEIVESAPLVRSSYHSEQQFNKSVSEEQINF